MCQPSATLIWLSRLETLEESVFRLCGRTYTVDFKVSPVDKMFVLGKRWSCVKGYIVCKDGPDRDQFLHTLIAERMTLDIQSQIDHKDRDRLNNRRDNLRPATRSQNAMNRPQFKNNSSGQTGVHRLQSGKWQARGQINGKRISLGCFDTFEKASETYRNWAEQIFGEFAP